MPITEAIRQSPELEDCDYLRLSDYGIGVHKKKLFAYGGLPVIYQPNEFLDQLMPDMKWRHCEFDLAHDIDFSWQREWRVPGRQLKFTPEDDVIVVVKTEDDAMQLCCDNFEQDSLHDEVYFDVIWGDVTHEMILKAPNPQNVESYTVGRD